MIAATDVETFDTSRPSDRSAAATAAPTVLDPSGIAPCHSTALDATDTADTFDTGDAP